MVVEYISFRNRLVVLVDGRKLRIVQFVDSSGNALPAPYGDPPTTDDPDQDFQTIRQAIDIARTKGGGIICGDPAPTPQRPEGAWFLIPFTNIEPVVYH